MGCHVVAASPQLTQQDPAMQFLHDMQSVYEDAEGLVKELSDHPSRAQFRIWKRYRKQFRAAKTGWEENASQEAFVACQSTFNTLRHAFHQLSKTVHVLKEKAGQ